MHVRHLAAGAAVLAIIGVGPGMAPAAAGQTLNVGSPTGTSIMQLVDTLNDLLGTGLPPQFLPARPGDIRHSRAAISRARDLLGYNPKVDLRAGLERTLDWFRSQAP